MTTKFKMNKNDVRNMCIKYNMCTKCNNEQYEYILNCCNFEYSNFEILQMQLLKIATLIEFYSNEQTIENIMFCLMRDCVYTFFEINEN